MDGTVIGLIIGIVLAVVTILLILLGNKSEGARQAAVPQPATGQLETAAEPPGPMKEDDLVLIEGIGPKIARLLKEKGIMSFAQLAAADLPTLKKILQENGLQFAKPDSWPEQARLASEGKMDELKALQDKLVAGR